MFVITPQLIRVSDETHVWADNIQKDLSQIFELQEEIAMQIAGALNVTLLISGQEELVSRPTANLEAYDYYLQASALFGRQLEVENLRAIDLFLKALELDPEFAIAWSKLSEAYSRQHFYFDDMTTPLLAKNAIDRALEINPNLPQAHSALGFYYGSYVMDYDRALEELRIAEKYLPDNASVHLNFSFVHRRQGKWKIALDRARLAMELNPRDPVTYEDMADIYSFLRNYQEIHKYIDQAISLDSLNGNHYNTKVRAELTGGKGIESAREILRQAPKELDPVNVVMEGGILGLWRFDLIVPRSPDLPQRFAENFSGSVPHDYWMSLGQIYDLLGDSARAIVLYDSARVNIESEMQKYPEDFHMATDMGIIYSLLGRHEEAIQSSMRAKEILPISDCFW